MMAEQAPYSAEQPYEIAWIPGIDVRVGPHQAPAFSGWVNSYGDEVGGYALSVGHSTAGWPTTPASEQERLTFVALDLLFSGIPPGAVLREFWKIEQWRLLKGAHIGGHLFLEGGRWSPHNCDYPDEHRSEVATTAWSPEEGAP